MKRTAYLQRKTPLRSFKRLKQTPFKKQWFKPPPATMPDWIAAIPLGGGHGTGQYEKRLWRLTTDYVRIRDWHKYGGRCVATGRYISSWKAGSAGHFIRWSVCNASFKFHPMNIHLQSIESNSGIGYSDYDEDEWGTSDHQTLIAFERTLRQRYGKNIIEHIKHANRQCQGHKFGTYECMQAIDAMLTLMYELPEKPLYFKHVVKLRAQHRGA